jgi:hypothetical protein
MSDTATVSTVSGDGGKGVVGQLDTFKKIIGEIRAECADTIRASRREYENVVFCKWPGQRPDGRKRKETIGSDAKPFEGASDNRVRLADKLIREHVSDYIAATIRAKKKFMPMEGMDNYTASKLDILVKWLIDTYWADQFITQLKLMGRYMEQDTPAVACAMVDWVEERRLEYRTVEPMDLVDLFIQKQAEAKSKQVPDDQTGMDDLDGAEGKPDTTDDQEMAATIIDMCTMATMLPDLEKFLIDVMEIKPARAKKAARELQKDGKAEIPIPYLFKRGPECVALRLFDDVFIPANTTDPERARIIYRREWLTEPEIRERAIRLKWHSAFVQELLGDRDSGGSSISKGHEGKSGFEESNTDTRVNTNTSESNLRSSLWEIITAWHYATNDDGVMGIYTTTFSFFCAKEARASEPYKRKHGKMPFAWQKREELNDRLMDSRGIPELVSTDQQTFKLLRDSFEDHTQVSTLPPIKIPPNKPHFRVDIAPLGRVESNSRETTEFMTPPAYPISADKYWDKIRREINEDWGRPGQDMDPDMVIAIKQDRVNTFLALVTKIVRMSVQLCQEFMEDDMFARIIGGNNVAVNRSVKEIQGQFDMTMVVDVQDLTLEGVTSKAKVVMEMLRPMDTRSTIPYDSIIRSSIAAIDPTWAEAMPTIEAADQRETSDEKTAFVNMLNGVRPEMPESGINAPLRLQVLQGEIDPRQANPAAFPALSQASQLLIKERMDYLTFQASQMQNAQTGRIGVNTKKTDEKMMTPEAGPAGEPMNGGMT